MIAVRQNIRPHHHERLTPPFTGDRREADIRPHHHERLTAINHDSGDHGRAAR
jgi:hypothetical protein